MLYCFIVDMEKEFLKLNDIIAYKIALKESFDWNIKSKVRKLLTDEQYYHILGKLKKLPQELNQFIQFTNRKLTI